MLRSKKLSFVSSHYHPTQFPGKIVRNLSLAKTASSLAVFVPLYSTQSNVNFVPKEEPPKTIGGENVNLPKISDMKGKGLVVPSDTEYALHHPIKVK